MRSLTLAELADEAGAPVELIEWLVRLDQVRPLADGRFDARDAAILSTVRALLDSGIERDDLGWAIEGAGAGLASIGRMFADPSGRSGRTYAAVVESLGPAGPRLAAIYPALGLAEPAPNDHLRTDEEAVLVGLPPSGRRSIRAARPMSGSPGSRARRVAA